MAEKLFTKGMNDHIPCKLSLNESVNGCMVEVSIASVAWNAAILCGVEEAGDVNFIQRPNSFSGPSMMYRV